jgi:hypothetical protein
LEETHSAGSPRGLGRGREIGTLFGGGRAGKSAAFLPHLFTES